MIKINDKVYFDTDCLSGFLREDEMGSLILLFKKSIVLPITVYNEIVAFPKFRREIDKYIKNKIISVVDIEYGSNEYNVFNQIISEPHYKAFGKGEAAVISFAVCNSKKMASNNLSDVKSYIEEFNLINYTICDIFDMLIDKGIKTREEIDELFIKMKANGRMLPYNTYQEYLNKKVK